MEMPTFIPARRGWDNFCVDISKLLGVAANQDVDVRAWFCRIFLFNVGVGVRCGDLLLRPAICPTPPLVGYGGQGILSDAASLHPEVFCAVLGSP